MFYRLLLQYLTLVFGLLLWPAAQAADNDKALEWIVGYAAGGGSDVVARSVAEEMGRQLKRPVIVNNKPGAATNIAAEYVARSKDFGNVMLSADLATLSANPTLFSKLSYSAEKDLASVSLLARFPLILIVSNKIPVKNFKEFLAWAKANPDALTYASAGAGSPHHLTMELLAEQAGLKLTHIPYRGAAPALTDVAGGQVPFMFVDTASGNQFIAAGRVKAIGVAGSKRIKTSPEIPTLAEQGLKGFEAYAWQGVAVPSGTSVETIKALNKALVAALNSAPVKARFQVLGVEPIPSTPEEMTAYAKAERERWARVIRNNHITID